MSGDGPLQDIVCCMGMPAAGNPTQFIMERAFAAAGLEWRCLTFEVSPERLTDAIRGIHAMGFHGASISSPHRIPVVPLLDGLSPRAELVGAVNCVYRDSDRLMGDNTDGEAFLASLPPEMLAPEKRFVVLGAGGAARAVACHVAQAGVASITIVSRNAEHGTALVERLNQRLNAAATFTPWEDEYSVAEGTDILVNATQFGLADQSARLPLDTSTLRPETLVIDLVVNPPQTRLLRDAAQRGCPTLHGLSMLVKQCAANFKIWTGIAPDETVMRESLEEYPGVLTSSLGRGEQVA